MRRVRRRLRWWYRLRRWLEEAEQQAISMNKDGRGLA